MADVSSLLHASWGLGTSQSNGVHAVWGRATDVQSLGGAYTPGAAPPGGTPIVPNTDADFVISSATNYRQHYEITVTDLRDSTPIQFESMSMSCDDGAICWTLNANGPQSLFSRFTTGDAPVIEVSINGVLWQFVIEGVRRARDFPGAGVSVTGRSPSIVAGEPYQFPQNWVNDGPVTANQLAAQAQVYTGLEIDWQVDDWLIPDRVFSFTGSPLQVVQRVAESINAVTRADRVDPRIAILPRYRALPNEWRKSVPEIEIHIDVSATDSWERSDKPAYTGVYVSGQTEGAIGKVYLAGTTGDQLAPMITDALLTEIVALRQRGEAFLGQGGAQAAVRITMPFLTGGAYPGVIEINWLARIVESALSVYYGVVRAVSIDVAFGVVNQTITLEVHTKDITGTVTRIPAPPTPSDGLIAWYSNQNGDPPYGSGLDVANSGSGTASNYVSGGITTLYAGMIGWAGETIAWEIASWVSPDGHPAPVIETTTNGWAQIQWQSTYGGGFPVGDASIGTLTLTATINGSPVPVGQRLIAVTAPDMSGYPTIAWGPEP